MTEVNVDEPWAIRNALAKLEEARDRYTRTEPEREKTIRLAMEYAIQVVKGINLIPEPVPPDPKAEADRAVRRFCDELGYAFENLGHAFHEIADGVIPERRD
jgi:hypothetical protein